jgi:cytochrome c oxidase cbb3-type subunit 1
MMTEHNTKVIKQFTIATIFWGIIGMLVGVYIAAQLAWPALNFDIPWLTYSRLRPLHTNAVIFAFGGNALLGTSLYVAAKTCQVKLFSDKLASLTFWGYQLVIVGAVLTLPFGFTQSKELCGIDLASGRIADPGLGDVWRGLLRHTGDP